LSTRESNDNEGDVYVYTLMWFKKQGGAVVKSVNCSTIKSLSVIQSNRPLSYSQDKEKLMLESECSNDASAVAVKEVGEKDKETSLLAIPHYVFMIIMNDGKEHILRASKIDKMIQWMNTLALVSMFFGLLVRYLFCSI